MRKVKYALPPDDVKLKSIGEVIKDNSEYKDLIIDVLENLGDLEDESIYYDIDNISNNGADGGYGNYIYYSDMNKWLSNRDIQKEIGIYFADWADELYNIDEDLSYLLVEYELVEEDEFNDDIYFDTNLFNLTYLVCKGSPFFRSYDGGDLLTSVYQIYKYMDNDKDVNLDGQDATFISWFVLEGVCYMFDK